MMLHKCTEAECPFLGQRTRGCGCHQTDEQVLRAENARLRAALERIAGDFVPSNRSEDGLALDEIRECASAALSEGA